MRSALRDGRVRLRPGFERQSFRRVAVRVRPRAQALEQQR
jgi:hypothetical protein